MPVKHTDIEDKSQMLAGFFMRFERGIKQLAAAAGKTETEPLTVNVKYKPKLGAERG